ARAKNADEQFRTYVAALTGMDAALGRLFAELESMGVAQNTLIVFSSDNGPEDYAIGNAANAGMGYAGELRARKRSIYEGGVRVPLLVVWPGHVPAGRVDRESILSAVDLVPTLAALIGSDAAKPDHAQGGDGEDVSPAWLGGSHSRQKPLMWEWRFNVSGAKANSAPQLAIRRGEWKYLCDPEGAREELYRIVDDTEEHQSVAMEHPEIVGQLRKTLLDWHREMVGSP
ncbi:MAG: sulfatase, partial [Cephaloticoccus sp.]